MVTTQPGATPTWPGSAERLKAALADRYAIERELGAGGMATVYLAEDLKYRRNVAVKVLRPELAASLGPERFVRKIEVAAQLHHPHILPLYDSGEADGFLYYVMPYVEGETLRDRLEREKQLPLDDAVQIAREVADAPGPAAARPRRFVTTRFSVRQWRCGIRRKPDRRLGLPARAIGSGYEQDLRS